MSEILPDKAEPTEQFHDQPCHRTVTEIKPSLPSPRQLLSVFAKAETFGQVADTPFGIGYQLDGLSVAGSYFGHHVYFGYQQAVLVLANEMQVSFAEPSHGSNNALLQKIYQLEQRYANRTHD